MPTEIYVYWDSCVFIDAIQKTKGRIETLKQILAHAEIGKVVIVTSMLSLAEVCKCSGTDADPSILSLSDAEKEKLISDFFENPYIRLRPVDRLICAKARELVRTCGIKPPDAIHIATAIQYPGVTHVSTYDDPLTRKIAAVSVGVTVGLPVWLGDRSFPDMDESS